MAEPRELIHLGFQLFQPHAALEPWVQCYWVIDCPTCNPSFERVYPDGGSSLIFDLTAPDPAGTIFAANQAPQIMAVSGTLLGIRFQPTGAHQLLGLPMKELGGEVITRAHILAPDLIGLCERLSEASLAKQIEMLEAWMLGRVRSLPYPGRLGEALAAFLPSQPRSMQALVSELAVSRRTAERLLREQTGNTLGQLQAWARVRQARRLIKLEHAFNLTEIGLTCGYYDQSHFIREFKNATTFTPTEYRKRQRIRVAQGEMALGAQGQTSGEYGFGQSMAPRTASARP